MRRINLVVITLVLAFAFQACRSGKKAYQKGNYYLSVIQSCDKLRSSPKNKKARIALADAYPLAIQTIELNNTNLQSSNSITKWKSIVRNYNNINRMYEEILRSPGALSVIPKPVNRYAELENAKKNAAEESYARGIDLLNKNNRNDAIQAYNSFLESQSFVPNYKDSNEKLEQARRIATIFVLIKQDPVPANFVVSGTYFKNKIDEFLHGPQARKNFIEYYRPDELTRLGLKADHELTLRYQDFSVGNVYVKERVEQLTRDSVVVGSIAGTSTGGTTTSGTDSGNTRNTDTRGSSNNTGSIGVSETSGSIDNTGSIATIGSAGNMGNSGSTVGTSNSGGTSKNPRNSDTKGNSGSSDTEGNSGNSGSTGNSDTKGNSGNSGNTDSGSSGNNKTGNSSSGSSSSNNRDKVSVCHNGKTLSISSSALQAHLDHGDSSGPCSAKDTGNSGNTGNSGSTDNTGNDNKNNSGGTKDKGTPTTTNTIDDQPKGNSDPKGKSETGSTNTNKNKSGSSNKGSNSGGTGSGKMNLTVGEEGGPVSGELAASNLEVYGTVKATLTTYEKTISSKALLSMTLTEVGTGRVLKQDLFPAEHIWLSSWGTFNGDERALSDEQYKLCQQKELLSPTRDESFNFLSEEFYKQVTENILRFYNNF